MSTDATTTAADEQPQQPPVSENLSEKLSKMNISSATFSIWPPTQRTRDAVVNRLIETLSTPSVLSKRYGSMPLDEASSTARSIEDEAFSVASSAAAAPGGGDGGGIEEGIEILQVYSKEISTRMLEAVKSRSATPAEAEAKSDDATVVPVPDTESSVGAVASEEGDNESSA